MASTFFTHRGCGGSLVVDCSGMFSLRSPSISVSSMGISIGAVEISEKMGNLSKLMLTCIKCEAVLEIPEKEEEISVECVICHKKKPVKDILVSREYSSFCTTCNSVLNGEKSAPEGMGRTFSFLAPPTKSYVKPLATILSTRPNY